MIIRVEHARNYLVIQNEAIQDKKLSLRATGLLVLLLSFPDNTRFTRQGIARLKTDGVHTVRAALCELANAGYYHYDREQDNHGRWRTITVLSETPGQTEGRSTAIGGCGQPGDNTPQIADPGPLPKADLPTFGGSTSKDFSRTNEQVLADEPNGSAQGPFRSSAQVDPQAVAKRLRGVRERLGTRVEDPPEPGYLCSRCNVPLARWGLLQKHLCDVHGESHELEAISG